MNQEDEDYISEFTYITADEIKAEIKKEKLNAIVVITSPSCSGVDNFMPKIKKEQQKLKDARIKVYHVSDVLNTPGNDRRIQQKKEEYQIDYDPYVISQKTYPAGNLLNPKKKYSNFLSDLCDDCNDGSLGYPKYIYFKNGEYENHSYFLKEEMLANIK